MNMLANIRHHFEERQRLKYFVVVFPDVVMFIIPNVWQGLLERRETGCVFFVTKLVFRVFLLGRVKRQLESQ